MPMKKEADAVVGIRFTTSAIMDGSSEIMVFDTAMKYCLSRIQVN